MTIHRFFSACALFSMLACSAWGDSGGSAADVQGRWDRANFALTGDEREAAMAALVADCKVLVESPTASAELLTWCGIAESSYAGMAGSLSAMKYAKAARADLERALEIDPSGVNGAAQTSLGTLFFKVPGWPIGFGDDARARELLQAGLEANPDGMDSNYFYADFLVQEKSYTEARPYLEKALEAPPRPGREIADQGRRRDIQALLAELDRREER